MTGRSWPTAEVGHSTLNDRKRCKTAGGPYKKSALARRQQPENRV